MTRLAEEYAKRRLGDSCLLIATQALAEAKKIRSTTAQAEALYALAQGYRTLNNHKAAIIHYLKTLAICKKEGYFGQTPYSEDNLQIKILIGVAAHYDGFQIDSSLYYRMELLALSTHYQTYRLKAKTTLDIGNSYLNGGDYAKALDFYLQSLELKKKYKLKDLVDEDCHRAIGYLYITLGDFQKAKPYLFQAKKIKESLQRGTYYEQAHLSNAYEALNQLDSALYFAKGGVKEALHHHITHELGYIFMTYAKALERYGHLHEALYWYKRGINACIQQNNQKTLSVVYAQAANLCLQLGKIDSSFYYATQGIRCAIAANFPRGFWEASKALSQTYKIRHQPDSALKYQDLMLAVKDSLFRHEKAQRIEIIEVEQRQLERARELANEKAQQQRKLITIAAIVAFFIGLSFIFYRNQMLKRQNIALQAALLEGQTTERKRVAADLHDALGSTLSSLRWSIGTIDKNKLEPKEQEVYQHVQSTIEQAYDQVRLLSHNLLPEELEKQGLWKALEILIKKLNRNTPVTFSLQLTDNPARLNSKTEFELYSICLELINNILKHAQATEATIRVELTKETLLLTVSDNGKGMDNVPQEGKGLRNIATRLASLQGHWTNSDNTPFGTTHLIRIPL